MFKHFIACVGTLTYLKPENFLAYSHCSPVKISLVLSDPCLPLRTRTGRNLKKKQKNKKKRWLFTYSKQ